jgi:hypothetical protein
LSACTGGDRVFVLGSRNTDIDRLGLRAFQLRLRLDHIRTRSDADLVLILGQVQSLLVGNHGVVEQALLFVGDAQLEIGLRQRGLQRQARVCQGRRAGLRTGDVAFDRAPHAAP